MMTSPVIESFPSGVSASSENYDTGFPFDTDDAHFRTELEDIALRHPEFAEHLNPAQRRANTDRFRSHDPFADYRQRSGDWPFGGGSRFQQFGFPFTPEFDEDPLNQQHSQQQRQHQQAASERPPEKQEDKVNEKPPQKPVEEEHQQQQRTRRNIQPSNTVDLGQKQQQETVDENGRNQRSMSAPPENRNASNKRFVSSINIPNFNQPPTADSSGSMGGRMSQQPETPPQQQNKPTERIIPIHIEGRDVPIIPKNVNISGSASSGGGRPEPERIFGQRPSTFTQFVNKDADAEKQREELAKQQQEYQRQQQEYQKQQQQSFQQQQQQQQEEHKATPPPETKPSPLDIILNIQKDVSKLMEDVAKFEGKPKDKQYLYLDEMLTRNMLKLDNIETEGKDAIRQARKEAIKCIEQCIQVLENKANANAKKAAGEKMEVESEAKPTEEPPQTTEVMDVEAAKPAEPTKEESNNNKDEKPPTEEAKPDETKPEEVSAEKSEPSQEEAGKPKEDEKKGKKKSESK